MADDCRDGGTQLIGKPFQRQQLARKVAEMLGTRTETKISKVTENAKS